MPCGARQVPRMGIVARVHAELRHGYLNRDRKVRPLRAMTPGMTWSMLQLS